MPLWPFKKRRRNDDVPEIDTTAHRLIESEKLESDEPLSAPVFPSSRTSSPIPIPRKSSKRPTSPIPIPPKSTDRATSPIPIPPKSSDRAVSPLPIPPKSSKRDLQALDGGDDDEKYFDALEKENVAPGPIPIHSTDAITALPMSYKLQNSPHLRPVDMEKPHIPYNFRPYSGSQTSVQPETATASPRSNVLKKKRSSYEAGSMQRKRSTRSKKEEHLREEEIRAMSAQSPVPKRAGDGPLRRDSKKMRSGMKESVISLPAHEESVHESLPGIVEQRGWEIGALDIFNPRPAVRLSGVPQYVTPASPPMSPPPGMRMKEKKPMSRDSARKRDTIGKTADDLDANDLRILMERDAKRREKRKQEQQEKLDRKLRKETRGRSDTDRRRREAEEALRSKEFTTPPSDVHPALRDRHHEEEAAAAVGLGIASAGAGAGASKADEEAEPEPESVSAEEETQGDPFADPVEKEEDHRASVEQMPESYTARTSIEQMPGTYTNRTSVDQMPGTYTPSETHTEEPIVATAQAVRMSQAATPPLSPIYSSRATPSLTQIAADSQRASDAPTAESALATRRQSQPIPERRTGALASLFRRGGATSRRASQIKAAPSEPSFSNTSRESMRNQPLPAHLVDTRVPSTRRASGTPTRTQSKFREDLPEMPISPPDSRTASPDAVTAAAAARRAQTFSAPIDIKRQGSTTTSGSEVPGPRYDTPISPSLRPGTSMASVDSEAAWLASGSTKRQSRQSGLGSRRPEFSNSFEDLGADTDAQHFSRASINPETPRDNAGLADEREPVSGRSSYERARDLESPEQTVAADGTPRVHDSVRRRPTLVHRDPRVRSREGLLTEYAGDIAEPTSATTGRGSLEMDSDFEGPEPELGRATSVRVHGVHARNTSTGSAVLLDVPARRGSQDIRSGASTPGTPRTPKI